MPSSNNYPTPVENDFFISNFEFNSKESLSELRLHYTTIGNPQNPAVLVLHGTTGSASTLLTTSFAGELFGPDQALDANKYFLIIPDAIGTGKSSKPSDGLKINFPQYNYADMVKAQYLLITEHLKISKLHLIIGFSMGGMHAWMWGHIYPQMMNKLVPMASLPIEVAGRNWLTRRMLLEMIRKDPAYQNGNYTHSPAIVSQALAYFSMATNGGNQALLHQAPTRDTADTLFDQMLSKQSPLDANDLIYQYEASRGYNPLPHLQNITCAVLAINSLDDERNPVEFGTLEDAQKVIPQLEILYVPGSPQSQGHLTLLNAALWHDKLVKWLN
jgi:homoserine O-acetyltransferase